MRSLCLPGRSGHEVPLQQPHLAEQDPVDEWHRRELLQRKLRLELEFLLFHEERHRPSIKLETKEEERSTEALLDAFNGCHARFASSEQKPGEKKSVCFRRRNK